MATSRTRRLMQMTMAADRGVRTGTGMDYGRMEGGTMNYDAESRFRDRSGRWHYDNGRFAPRSETNIEIEGRFRDNYDRQRRGDQSAGMTGDTSMAYRPYLPPVYRDEHRYDGTPRQIGFMAGGSEVGRDYRSDAEYRDRDEMEQHRSHAQNGHASGGEMPPLTREKAEQWVRSMEGSGGPGQTWTMEQARHIMTRHGYQCDPLEFYVALNMMKSDYSKVAAQMGVDKEEFYAGMARAFLKDEDAHPDKLARYWSCIVKK